MVIAVVFSVLFFFPSLKSAKHSHQCKEELHKISNQMENLYAYSITKSF